MSKALSSANHPFLTEESEKFPIGIYHISHYNSQKAQRLKDLEDISKMGFDFVAMPLDTGDAAAVTLCENLNLGILIEYNETDTDVLAEYTTDIFIGHIVGDDIDVTYANRAAYVTAEANRDTAATNNGYPGLPTYGSLSDYNNASDYAGVADWLADQCYPITSEALSAPQSYWPPCISAAATYDQPMFANTQLFTWAAQSSPTADQVYALAWQSVALGCHGCIFYTYADHDFGGESGWAWENHLSEHPEWRGVLRRFIRQVRKYEKFFVKGTRSEITKNATTLKVEFTLSDISQKVVIEITYATAAVDIKLRRT